MTDYAGVDEYPTTIPIPDDGDDENVLSVAPALEGLKDATVNLKLHKADATDGTITDSTLTDCFLTGTTTIEGILSLDNVEVCISQPDPVHLGNTTPQTLDTATGGQCVWIGTTGAPGADIALILRDDGTTPTPPIGYEFDINYHQSTSSHPVTIARQTTTGGHLVATLGGSAAASWPIPLECVSSVRVRRTSSGWKLAAVLGGIVVPGADAF